MYTSSAQTPIKISRPFNTQHMRGLYKKKATLSSVNYYYLKDNLCPPSRLSSLVMR